MTDTLKQNLENSAPYYGLSDLISPMELEQRVQGVQEAAIAAHTSLYDDSHETVIFDDEHSDDRGQYVSFKFKGEDGRPCFFSWDETDPATDVGVRGANRDFNGTLNPVTVVHAGAHSYSEFVERGAPKVVLDAVGEMADFNQHMFKTIVLPYFRDVALAFNKDPQEYQEKFFAKNPDNIRKIVARLIMYHESTAEGVRPVGSDGQQLLIKQHCDKGAFTFDVWQSGEGLQYYNRATGEWVPAQEGIAAFRGAADDYLSDQLSKSLTRPTVHRAVMSESLYDADNPLRAHGLVRTALPLFVASNLPEARKIKPNSAETHPLQAIGQLAMA